MSLDLVCKRCHGGGYPSCMCVYTSCTCVLGGPYGHLSCPVHSATAPTYGRFTFTPDRLHPDDIEAIAQRVAEKMRESP